MISRFPFQPQPSRDPHGSYNKPISTLNSKDFGKKNLTLSAVVNCASALSMQLTEMQ